MSYCLLYSLHPCALAALRYLLAFTRDFETCSFKRHKSVVEMQDPSLARRANEPCWFNENTSRGRSAMPTSPREAILNLASWRCDRRPTPDNDLDSHYGTLVRSVNRTILAKKRRTVFVEC